MRKLITDAVLAKMNVPIDSVDPDVMGEWCLMRWSSDANDCGPVGSDPWSIHRYKSKAIALRALGAADLECFAAPMSALKFTLREWKDGKGPTSGTVIFTGSYGEALRTKEARMAAVANSGSPVYTSYRLEAELTEESWIPELFRKLRSRS